MTAPHKLRSISKFLSYVLRHHPESIGVAMNRNGWVDVSELIEKAAKAGKSIDRELIREVIASSGRQRFVLSSDDNYIRAGYGHSVDVDLQLHPQQPPPLLYHGTAHRNLTAILQDGINSASRKFVHLAATKQEARNIGSRHGKPVILTVQAKAMHQQGFNFFQSDSAAGIWLVDYVPVGFISA